MDGINSETNQISSKKGEEGEAWIDSAADIFGWKAVKFHPWQASADRLYYRDGKAYFAQSKNKEPRKLYPDTGLEKYRFKAFQRMCAESGIPGMILFTDSSQRVYGEFLENLKEETHGGEHNKVNNTEMIYFWLKDLKDIKDLMK